MESQHSLLTRFSGAAVGAVERGVGFQGGRLFNRAALQAAGLKMAPAEFLVLLLSGAVVAGFLGFVAMGPVGAILLALIVPIVGWAVLSMRASKRRGFFDTQLPDLLMTLSGSLRAGHSVMRAFDSAIREFESPMSEELSRIVNEARVGRDPELTMMEIAKRMGSEDFAWIAEAILINREVGGDLAQVLDQVGETINERAQIKGQVRALAAEGKLSAYILIALPVGLSLMLGIINPTYIGTLFTHIIGIFMLITAVVMLIIGSIWMSRTIQIKF
ncbi:type II secretion system F family protein [Arthrobacter sp. UCD-GKA]|uniref:type II secretion system F family protein n=1 Tax=Arthrobacter sp. UCD-GKA TaxID=1913576 RepID=UPI00256FFACF|nr:type II secretion system F family protein [Arthrobacter sp. UCD-GKA]